MFVVGGVFRKDGRWYVDGHATGIWSIGAVRDLHPCS